MTFFLSEKVKRANSAFSPIYFRVRLSKVGVMALLMAASICTLWCFPTFIM